MLVAFLTCNFVAHLVVFKDILIQKCRTKLRYTYNLEFLLNTCAVRSVLTDCVLSYKYEFDKYLINVTISTIYFTCLYHLLAYITFVII